MSIANEVKERLGKKVTDWYQHTERRYYISIEKQDLKEAAKILYKELGMRFSIATGQDTPKGIDILYHFSFDKTGELFSLRVIIEDRNNPQIDTLTGMFPAAEWIDREMWELLGINFIGHPNLKHLLLIDNWPQGKYPLRKG
jgi:Ni,Fe-hydrogenase III component G